MTTAIAGFLEKRYSLWRSEPFRMSFHSESPSHKEGDSDGRVLKEATMDYILDFEKLDKNALAVVGGKNASLGEMIKADIRVPPGFAVTTDSYLIFITDGGIKDRIIDAVSNLDPEDVEALNKARADVQELIKKTPMPETDKPGHQKWLFTAV